MPYWKGHCTPVVLSTGCLMSFGNKKGLPYRFSAILSFIWPMSCWYFAWVELLDNGYLDFVQPGPTTDLANKHNPSKNHLGANKLEF